MPPSISPSVADDDNRVKYSWYHNGAAITRVLDVITSDFNCTREGGGFTSTCTNETIPTGYSIREFKGGEYIYLLENILICVTMQ